VILDIPGVIFINAHAGRLPKYGGMNVVEWAVYNDEPVYGTVHRIERGIDTGDILQEALLVLGRPPTVADLRAVAFVAAWAMVPETLTKLANGELSFRKQRHDLPRIQWYRMHPELLKVVQAKLDDKSFFGIQEWHLAQAGVRAPMNGQSVPLRHFP
jgi:methionyl-tRNA formyltransferase